MCDIKIENASMLNSFTSNQTLNRDASSAVSVTQLLRYFLYSYTTQERAFENECLKTELALFSLGYPQKVIFSQKIKAIKHTPKPTLPISSTNLTKTT